MKGLNLFFRLSALAIILAAATTPAAAQCISGNCQNGNGTYRYSAASKYTGQFHNGLRHGNGKMTYSDGSVYEGPFKHGKKHGDNGTITYINGDKYVGQWANDYPNGKGKYYFKTKERYEGDFINGEFDGQGRMTYADGAYYNGGWKKSKKHGTGTLVSTDGEQKSGTWNQGKWVSKPAGAPNRNETSTAANNNSKPKPPAAKPNNAKPDPSKPDVAGLRNCGRTYCSSGQGYYDYPDGSRWVGEFKEGFPSGRGVCYYANGDRYEGEWANNAPYGEGVMYFATGRVYGAVWVNGSPVKELDSDETVPSEPVRAEQNRGVKIWAVVVGVGKYTAMPSLKFTDDDAFRFYSHLKSPEGGALSDDQIEILVDEGATRENILKTMRSMFLKADENDVVMFYFSGHGLEGCFLPVDFDGYNNKLRHEEIRQILKQSKAKHKLCIADACHSGTLDYSGALASKGPAPVSLNRFYQAFEEAEGGIALLMSSKPEELSLEDHGLRQGVFTYYVLRGMKGAADSNGDYIVSIKELYGYVYAKVRDYTAGVQTPVLTGDYDDLMPVSLRRQ
ncbi:MAG: caspase family protein [Saprospiraceae bacterium]|nr:caspase family protein [Saprospiraceae bacterium]